MDFDYLESVAARYQGEARVQRLLWIAQQATAATTTTTTSNTNTNSSASSDVAAAAWTHLAHHFREMGNVHRTRDLVALLTSLQRTTDPTHSSRHDPHDQHPAARAATTALRALHAADFPDGGGHSTTNQHSSSSASSTSSSSLTAWTMAQDNRNKHTRDALQARLSQAQAHLHKDAIRAAYVALANHELQVGPDPPTEAFHLVLRAKDYCVTRPQTATVSLQILEVALALKNYGSVREYVTKLEHTLDSGWGGGGGAASSASAGGGAGGSSSNSTAGSGGSGSGGVPANWNELAYHRVKVASALEALSRGEFARAARVLLELTTGCRRPSPSSSSSATSEPTTADNAASPSSGTGTAGGASSLSWPTVLCGEEVAVYTAVLGLATLPRHDVLLLAEHADALEAAPLFRECLRHFHRGQYTAGWQLLPWDTHLALDAYLGPHLDRLKGLVVQRAILAYWQPYQRVDVATMARELHGMVPDPDSLLRHLVDVIAASHNSPDGSGATPTAAVGAAGAVAMAASAAPQDVAAAASATPLLLGSSARPDASAPLPKLLDTRIDLPARTLVRHPVEPDHQVWQVRAEAHVRRLATQVLDDSYALVVRLACQEHGLAVATAGGVRSDRRGGPRPSSPAWNRRRGGGGGRRGGGPNPRRGRGDAPHPVQDARGDRDGLPAVLPAVGAGGVEGPGRPGPEDVELDDLVSSEEDVYQPHDDDEDEEDSFDDEHGMDDVADDMNPEDLY